MPKNLLPLPKPQTLIQKRLIETSGLRDDGKQDVAFQHSILCQTSLPYRDPGDDVRLWGREQGAVSLRIEAGAARHPKTLEWVELGLPWGTKPRLILAHLNAEALRQGSPEIEVEGSLSAFVKRIRGFQHGREIRAFKDQLSRLSGALVRLAMTHGERAFQIDTKVVTAFQLWPDETDQRVLWPATIRLSLEYFESLKAHAVPLDEQALAALSHSAMALDVYAWLAQRLHRIPKPHRQLIPWPAAKEQFGADYDRLRKFREKFLAALRQVHAVYPAAKMDVTEAGLLLHTSPPPVVKTGVVVTLPSG